MLAKLKNINLWITILLVVTIGAYWPIRQILVIERPADEIITSNLTITFLMALAAWGGVSMAYIDKKFKKLHWAYRTLLWIIGILIIMVYLSFIGYTPRWIFPPVFR